MVTNCISIGTKEIYVYKRMNPSELTLKSCVMLLIFLTECLQITVIVRETSDVSGSLKKGKILMSKIKLS